MNNLIDTLYELCETLSVELSECNEKIRKANGKLTAGDVEYLDKLTHAMKSVKTTIAMIEAEEQGGYSRNQSGRYYYDGEASMDGGSSYRGSYEGGSSNRGSYEYGGSYGRGRNARRDSMGRYAERYSRAEAKDDVMRELEEAMAKAPDEESRKKIEKLMTEMR